MAEGTSDQILSFTTNLVSPALRPSRTLYISVNEAEQVAIKERLARFGFEAQLLDYDSLATISTRSLRGKSIVISSPGLAVNRADAIGVADGSLVRILASPSWKQIIVTRKTSAALHIEECGDASQICKRIAQDVAARPSSEAWLEELLLELLYRRHASFAGILRLATGSVWWHTGHREAPSIHEALQNLLRMDLVTERRGCYTSNGIGRLVVERRVPINQLNLAELREQYEADNETTVPENADDSQKERLAYFEESVLNLVKTNGWTTVNAVAREAARVSITKKTSRGVARRFLEGLVADGTLVRSVYNRGKGRPTFVFHQRESSESTSMFENRCGDCALYTKVARRCRLWWALSRYSASEVYSRKGELSTVARDKLLNANVRIGPNATACEVFAPKKRDFPLTKARDVCLGCGKDIESPVLKLVRCPNCGTAYKPLYDRILVSYSYEQLFRDRYFQIAGVNPPDRALLLPGQEYYGKSDWRDLVVLYPHETIRLGADGMYVSREEGGNAFQPYERIYQVVDYGALGPDEVSILQRKGISLAQKLPSQGKLASSTVFYPSFEFVENLRFLEEHSRLRRRFLESLMLSVIVATKRIADRGGLQLQVTVNRQLLEYKRMVQNNEMSVSRALAYEARVNNLYWSVYKTMLRVSGLDFKSRVRDRFVREFVQSIRARAKGYSPANAGINYLHQRRLNQCRIANAEAGIGWIGCEGILHIAKRKPSIGLLLDLSDSFRLADRESFLSKSLRFEISREDFVASLGRHRLWFFYPSAAAVEKLETVGSTADMMQVIQADCELGLTDAYQKYVSSFVKAVQNRDLDLFHPFIYGTKNDLDWLNGRVARRVSS